jgi:hypothetical protein
MPRLAEYLEASGPGLQDIVFQSLDRARPTTAAPGLWQRLALDVLDWDHLERQLVELSTLERDLLDVCLFSATGASDRELLDLSRRLGAERGTAQEALYTLSRTGLVVCTRGWSNDIVWIVPDDLADRLVEVRRPHAETWVPRIEAPANAQPLPEAAILRDLLALIVLCEREPLQVTQQTGLLYKRALEKTVLPRFEVKERLPADGSHPPRLSWMLEFALSSQLLVRQENRLTPTATLQGWLALSPLDQARVCFNFWSNRTLRSAQRQEHRVLVRLLQTLDASVWYDAAGMLPRIEHWFGKPAQFPVEAFRGLAMLGFIDWHHSAGTTFRLTELGHAVLRTVQREEASGGWAGPESETVVVQPNLEILVGPEVSLTLRYQLEQVSEFVRSDTLTTFRLTEEALHRALERGWTVDRVLEILASCTSTPLPQALEVMLADWAARHGRLSFWDVLVLRVSELGLAQELAQHPAIAPYVKAKITPQDLVVARKDHAALVEALQEMGHTLRGGIIQVDQDPAAATAKPRKTDTLVQDFGQVQRMPVAINHQVPRPSSARRTGPLRRRTRGGRDLPSEAVATLVQEAIQEARHLEIEYFAPTSGRTRRTIEPRQVHGDELQAFCHLKSDERRFAMANILEIWMLEG